LGTVRDYKELAVWQRGVMLAKAIYTASSRLPAREQFGLTSQMRRAAVSIPSNIAEGYGRQATGEYRRHLSYARGSALELETHLLICRELGYLDETDTDSALSEVSQLSRMLATLIRRLT
jgi:four helix bundle protein